MTIRAPLISSVRPGPRHDGEVSANLLVTVLAAPPAAQAPFAQLDWQFPSRRAWLRDDVIQNLLSLNTRLPFANVEWPAQRRWGWRDEPVQNLLGTTLAPVVPPGVPFAQLDWSAPLRRVFNDLWWAQNTNTNLLVAVAVVGSPFSQLEWPTSIRQRVIQPDVWQNLLGTVLTQVPFAQLAWPTSTQRQRTRVDDLVNLIGLLAPAAVPFPFSQRDWSLPFYRRGIQAETPLNLQTSTLAAIVAGRPFVFHDWPAPGWRWIIRLDPTTNLLVTTLVPPAAAPLRQRTVVGAGT